MHETQIAGLHVKAGRWPLDETLPTLVMVHGSGGSTVSWAEQIEALADVANTVAVDLPEHGQTDGPGRGSIEEYSALVAALIREGEVPRAVPMGHSLGGAVALQLLLDEPELVHGAVLVGTGAKLKVAPMIFQALQTDFAASVAMMDQLAAAPSTPKERLAAYREDMATREPEVVVGDFTACDAFDVRERLGVIAKPVLILCGEHDQLTPVKYADYLAANTAGAQLVKVADAGHLVMLEQPEAVNAAVRGYLARL